jgi:hypothetical protein
MGRLILRRQRKDEFGDLPGWDRVGLTPDRIVQLHQYEMVGAANGTPTDVVRNRGTRRPGRGATETVDVAKTRDRT